MKTPTLSERLADHTQSLLLQAAVQLLERDPEAELTIRAVAREAGMSERTVFRYFANRDEFLDAVAIEVNRRMALPDPPETMAELLAYTGLLYRRFDAASSLSQAALHSQIYGRLRDNQARQRGTAVERLLAAHAPGADEALRRMTAFNVRYYLTASTWHYYRFAFGLSPDDAIACAQLAVRRAVDALRT